MFKDIQNIAYKGELETLIEMIEEGHKVTEETMLFACEGGQLHIVKYLYETLRLENMWSAYTSFRILCNGDYIETLKYVLENGCPYYHYIVEHAVKENRIECVKYLVNCDKYIVSKTLTWEASLQGNLEMLKFLHEKTGYLHTKSHFIAIKRGHLDCLKYIRQFYQEWNDNYSEIIAQEGRVNILQYALEEGLYIDTKIIAVRGVQHGHFCVLKWAYENGFPIKGSARFSTMKEIRLNSFQYAICHGEDLTEEMLHNLNGLEGPFNINFSDVKVREFWFTTIYEYVGGNLKKYLKEMKEIFNHVKEMIEPIVGEDVIQHVMYQYIQELKFY